MPRRCLTCSHSKISEINSLLHNNQPYSTIAKRFNLEPTNVRYHMVNHIKPIIERANSKAERVIVDKILTYRKEVNYPPLEKVKFIQHNLLNELEMVNETGKRIAIIRELRGWFQEEAKLLDIHTRETESPRIVTELDLAQELYRRLIAHQWTSEKALEGAKYEFPDIEEWEILDQ